MSVFYRGLSQWQSAPPDNPQHLQSALLNFARQHGKPVMIAESSPQGFNIGKLTSSTIQQFDPQSVSAEDIWQTWYQPFFDFIYANRDIIRAVAYINTHWESQPMWHCALYSKAGTDDCANGYWGDARVQANPDIKQRWLEHSLDDNIWVQATQ
ncbi:Beta-1,3-xylanase TXYA [Thalassocella blandensis]|nr:Beta-1,3-xylanase TXYA [Thalassocella blandensis]